MATTSTEMCKSIGQTALLGVREVLHCVGLTEDKINHVVLSKLACHDI